MMITSRTHPARLLLRIGVIAAVAVVFSLTTALVIVDARPENVKAQAWAAEAARAGQLPDDLQDFISLPPVYRRHAKALMAPEQHSRLWRAWFERFEATNELNAEQVTFIQQIKALVSPDLYDLTSDRRPRLKAELAALCAKKRALFTAGQVAALSTIGSTAGPATTESRLVLAVRAIESFLGIAVASAGGVDDCECNGSLGAECGRCTDEEKVCKDKLCTEVFFECGCAGEDKCTDLCEVPTL